MAGSDSKTTKDLKTQLHELAKQYIEYDLDGRPSVIYTAQTNTKHGVACSKVTYEYVPGTSRVLKMKEDNATWDQAWDI